MVISEHSSKIKLRILLLFAGVTLIASSSCTLAHTDVTVEQARNIINSMNDLIVVDVREPSEYCDATGHIPGALNYPLSSGILEVRYEELPKDSPLLVVCRSGARSNQAANFLDSKGFSRVYDMIRGMMAWTWETELCKQDDDNETDSVETNTYVFLPDQSTLLQTGGIAGVNWNYSVEGYFQLTVDTDAGTGSFTLVDANAIDNSPFERTLNPNQVFNMNSLLGTILDETTISFTGLASDGSDVHITATFQDNLVHLVGQTTAPPNSADFFTFNLDATAQRKYGGGSGEPNDPYKIGTAEDLILLGESTEDYDKYFILTADIDLHPNQPAGIFDKAVIAPDVDPNDSGFQGIAFTGVLDGKGLKISHLTIEGGSYLGLFGQLDSGAAVTNLGLDTVSVNGTGDYIGGLAGINSGDVTNCFNTGTISGSSVVGGLTGANGYDSSITTSYSIGTVTGDNLVGGLVGNNLFGNIVSSYSAGIITGNDYVGGFVGWNTGSITASYSSSMVTGDNNVGGLVGDNFGDAGIEVSFWDMEISGQSSSDGGTGLTTGQMQMASTFLDTGWDFVDESENGNEDIWWINEGKDYPRLWWELIEDDSIP